jgi:hypothetical protein
VAVNAVPPGLRLYELARYYDNHDTSAELERARLETTSEQDPLVSMLLRLPKSLLDWVRAQAAAERVEPTELIRRWIEQQRATEVPRPEQSLEARVRFLEDMLLDRHQPVTPPPPPRHEPTRPEEPVTQPLHVPHAHMSTRRRPLKRVTARRIR